MIADVGGPVGPGDNRNAAHHHDGHRQIRNSRIVQEGLAPGNLRGLDAAFGGVDLAAKANRIRVAAEIDNMHFQVALAIARGIVFGYRRSRFPRVGSHEGARHAVKGIRQQSG